jgi:hypothetical protein
MKTNLSSLYKTNVNLETSGIWMAVGPKVEFLVKRFGGSNAMAVQKSMAKFHKPYAKQISTGSLGQEEINKIDAQVLVDACISGWKGVTDETGKEIEFSFEKAVEILIDLPELLRALLTNASNYENYKEEYREEVGNS